MRRQRYLSQPDLQTHCGMGLETRPYSRTRRYAPQIFEDFVPDSLRHFSVEPVPAEHALEVVREFLLEARLLEFVADKYTRLPFIEAEFNLVVNVRSMSRVPVMHGTHHSHYQCKCW